MDASFACEASISFCAGVVLYFVCLTKNIHVR